MKTARLSCSCPTRSFRSSKVTAGVKTFICSGETAVPITPSMNGLLAQMTADQQNSLTGDLNEGRRSLAVTTFEILVGGLAAVLIAFLLAIITRTRIAAPICG